VIEQQGGSIGTLEIQEVYYSIPLIQERFLFAMTI